MTQELSLIPPVGLHAEIIEVYQNGGELPANELLAMLNTPRRIQQRGFPATIEQLLAIIIDTWRITEDTRFFVYDLDRDGIIVSDVYDTPAEAGEIAGTGDNLTVKRFQL